MAVTSDAKKIYAQFARIVDSVFHAYRITTLGQSALNDGNHFYLKGGLTLPTLGNIDILLRVGSGDDGTWRWNGKWSFEFPMDTEVDIQLFEGVTVSDPGTPVPIYNNDRESENECIGSVFNAPTLTDLNAPPIWESFIGSGKSKAGTGTGFHYYIMTKKDTDYLMRLTNLTDKDRLVDYDLWGFQHSPRKRVTYLVK